MHLMYGLKPNVNQTSILSMIEHITCYLSQKYEDHEKVSQKNMKNDMKSNGYFEVAAKFEMALKLLGVHYWLRHEPNSQST